MTSFNFGQQIDPFGGSQNAWNGPSVFQSPVSQQLAPGMNPYAWQNQANQYGQQQMNYAQSPLYASLMASLAGPQSSMANNQYSNDTAYNIAEGNANNDQTLQRMRNEIAKYVAELENKSRTDVAGIGAEASKYGADRGMQGQLGSAKYGADASMYGSDKGYQASAYGSDRNLEGTKYTQDAGMTNTRTSTDAQKAIAAIQADAAKYAPGLQQQRFNALLPMLTQLFQGVLAKQQKAGTPYLGTMG